MSFTTKLILGTLSIALIIFIGALVLKKYVPRYEFTFPLLVSAIALAISLVSAFKNELFDFKLHLVPGSITLAVPSSPSHRSLARIYNLSFINEGYGHGIVEWVAVKISGTDGIKLYTPVAEVNYEKFLQGKRVLYAENILSPFSPFILGSKEATRHSILLSQDENNAEDSFKEWIPNKYKFELYIKVTGENRAQLMDTQEWDITQQMIDKYFNGEGAVLTKQEIKFD
ncbi:MAG: hypothetical protein RDU14_00820 [Melioribacteraceae bacterium]|nr:hypothetical protein [Melioribacteraceae bacterium]